MRLAPPDPKEIPLEMRLALRWVVWALEERQGKPTKVPYRPLPGPPQRASVREPGHWGSLYQALKALEEGPYQGLGFVLGGGFVGVDLDRALDPEGRPRPWALPILERAATLKEVSPSGRGLHLYLLAAWSGPNRRSVEEGSLEVYGEGRFFTFTARYLPGPRHLLKGKEAEEFLTWLRARYFPDPKPLHPPAPREAAPRELPLEEWLRSRGAWDLYLGRWQGRYPSQSEADLALANHLLAYTGGDLEAADLLFRRSGLYREKWDEPRGRLTYGQRTLRKALGEAV